MSALGQTRTFSDVRSMSALPPKADIARHHWHVRLVPNSDIGQIIRSPRRRGRAAYPQYRGRAFLPSLRLITNSNLVGSMTGRSAGLSPLEDAIDIAGRASVLVVKVRTVGELAAAGDGTDRRAGNCVVPPAC
jgi:hypothetical protein